VTGRAYSALLILLTIAIFVLGGILLAGLLFPENRVVTPRIEPVDTGQPPIISTFSYPFEKSTVTLQVPVNRSVYEGAKKADKSVTIIGNVSEDTWVTDSYRAMTNDPAQEELYRELIVQFRKIKSGQNLDDDEYLELMAVYVQSLKYETLLENPAKFPVETVVDQAGDCDDKSLLLAGLLSREGYSVALLSFGPEKHMAIGVGSRDYQYRNSSYAFLETTNVSYVGIPTESLGSGITLQSFPIIIPIGSGTRTYTIGAETAYIHDSMLRSKQGAEKLEPQVKSMQTVIDGKHADLQNLESRMLNMRASGRISEYNALVSTHNEEVAVYNARLDTYQQMYARYEKYAMVHNYILDHQYDRKGVFVYIRMNMPV
jgi:hypothetical protein